MARNSLYAVVRIKKYDSITITQTTLLKRRLQLEGVSISMNVDNEIVDVDVLFEGDQLTAIQEMNRLLQLKEVISPLQVDVRVVSPAPILPPIGNYETPQQISYSDEVLVADPRGSESREMCTPLQPIHESDLDVYSEEEVTPLDDKVSSVSHACTALPIGMDATNYEQTSKNQEVLAADPRGSESKEMCTPLQPIHESDLDVYSEEEVTPLDDKVSSVSHACTALPIGMDATNYEQTSKNQGFSMQRRQQFCVICQKPMAKLFRHLESQHQNDERVAKALKSCPSEKRRILDKFRREGYVELTKGEVRERSTTKYNVVPCQSCGVSFSKLTFHRHYQKCSGKKPPKNVISGLLTRQQLAKQKTNMSQTLKDDIIAGMQLTPDMMEAITQDETVVRYGNNQCVRYRGEIGKQRNLIRSRLRAVASVRILTTTLDDSIKNVMDLFHPSKFDIFVEAVAKFAKMEAESIKKKSPNNVLRVSLLFSNIAKDEKASCLPDEAGRKLKETISCWVETFERKFRSTLGWYAEKVAAKKKWSNRKLVPLADDMIKFNGYLKNEIKQNVEILKIRFDYKAWERLNKAAMTLLMTFNRKRVGEVMTINTEDYSNKSKIREGTDIYNSLSEAEKINAKQFYHLVIRGKLARPVPLLISENLAGTIDIILKYRNEAGVSPGNPALFAKGDGHFDANAATREAAFACGAQSPSDITSTALRKHIASITQAVNMGEGGIKTVCSFLGHTKQTHMENYRLPSDAINAARLSRLLVALDEGTITSFQNKSFDDIDADVQISTIDHPLPNAVKPPTPSQFSPPDAMPGPSTPLKNTSLKGKRSILPVRRRIPSSSESDEHTGTPEKSIPDSPIKTPRRVATKRNYWRTPEKRAMIRHFSDHLKAKTLPSLKQCTLVRAKEPALRNRKEDVMKSWIHNQNKKTN